MKIKIGLAAIGIPFIFFTINQLILQLLKPATQGLTVRLAFAFQPAIFGLFFSAAIIILIVIYRTLGPLFVFLKRGEAWEKARIASLGIPWILILTNSGLWIVAITLFYILQGFNTKGGVPYFWSLATNSMSGFVSAVMAALIINRLLIPSKIKLSMTDIRDGERDVFVKIKLYLIFISGFLYTVLIFCYAARYYYLTGLSGYEMIPFKLNYVLVFLSIFSFIPLISAVLLALGEDRIQRRYLKDKLDELIAGEGDLNRKVNLLNFDDTGQIAASINNFIGKIRALVNKVDQTGREVLETSRAVDAFVNDLTEETTIMLDAVNSIDDDLGEQETEFRHTRDSLLEYFNAIEKITGNIEEQSASVAETSSAINALADSIKSVNKAAHEVESLTGNLKNITIEGSGQIQNFINSINSIEDSSEHVAEMLEHMNGLSTQIDILAMNAAIEAAHAGEFGKGFSVVADEVKNLAESSADKSNEIAAHVSSMMKAVKQSNEKTGLANRAFDDISSNVNETSVHFHNIFQVLEEETQGVDELIITMTSLVSITEELKDIADIQKGSNRQMEGRIGGVFDRFGTIRDSLNRQHQNRKAIADALEGLKNIVGKNLEIVEELDEQLKGFSS
ncbi:MAG: hypothetical protein JEY99_05655 [Spirochaetales bacterium]|nr:hypothetical protein [Spirochaetales bacterium]